MPSWSCLPRTGHDVAVVVEHRGQHWDGHGLAVALGQFRLRVEGIDVGKSAAHVTENDGIDFGVSSVGSGCLTNPIVFGSSCCIGEEIAQSERAKTKRASGKHRASGKLGEIHRVKWNFKADLRDFPSILSK